MPEGSGSGELLENDPRNPCVGCGPGNPRGLQLAFRREGDRVVSDLVADETLEGWPDRLHSGVLYLAMLEVANWTVYGLRGRVGVPVETSALTLARWIPTGTRLRLVGVELPSYEGDLDVRVEARVGGEAVASLRRSYALADRTEFKERMGYDRLPDVLEEVVPEGAE